jgi:uncharacterized protein YukE
LDFRPEYKVTFFKVDVLGAHMPLFGSSGQGDSQLHDELKYLATSIESINQRLAGASGGISQKWLEGTDRKLYTVYQLVQETEKKLISGLETQSSLMRRSQQEQFSKLTTKVGESVNALGSNVTRAVDSLNADVVRSLDSVKGEFSQIRSEMDSLKSENEALRGQISQLVEVLRDQIALMREIMKRTE